MLSELSLRNYAESTVTHALPCCLTGVAVVVATDAAHMRRGRAPDPLGLAALMWPRRLRCEVGRLGGLRCFDDSRCDFGGLRQDIGLQG